MQVCRLFLQAFAPEVADMTPEDLLKEAVTKQIWAEHNSDLGFRFLLEKEHRLQQEARNFRQLIVSTLLNTLLFEYNMDLPACQ